MDVVAKFANSWSNRQLLAGSHHVVHRCRQVLVTAAETHAAWRHGGLYTGNGRLQCGPLPDVYPYGGGAGGYYPPEEVCPVWAEMRTLRLFPGRRLRTFLRSGGLRLESNPIKAPIVL